MKKINTYLLALMGVFALTWSACTDSYDYDPAPGVDGEGVYFPSSTQTSITLNGTEGNFTLKVQRTKSAGVGESGLTAEFNEGGASVFSVPAKVSFADGETETTLTVGYNNLVRGTTYDVKLSFVDGTSYGSSSLTFKVLYPAEVLEEWVVISTEAVLTENIFTPFGHTPITLTEVTVEKEKNSNQYRFQSPYDNDYFVYGKGWDAFFPADFVPPYIVLNGEKYKAEAPGSYYIASTALGFQMVNGVGPKYDMEWNTFGSVAGNLSSGGSPIPPTSTSYPLGSFDEKVKMFNFGAVYTQIGGDKGGYSVIPAGTFTLYLDPTLMAPDYDREYTWETVNDATGYFTSGIAGESWTQVVQQAKEDPTFYRFTSLYAQDVHIYFNYDAAKGTLTMPKMQPTGLTTYGNKIYVDAVPGKCTVNADHDFTFVLSFYLVDADGKKTAELMQSTETFLWGRGPLDQLVKGKKIEDYVGTWSVPLTDGQEGGKMPVSITKADKTTLLVQGLSIVKDYDDTMALEYDSETGFLIFEFQQVASINGYYGFVSPFNSETMELGTKAGESLIGGLSKDGILTFLNNPANAGTYDSMVYVKSPDGKQLGFMTGYWNYLEWTPVTPAASFGSLNNVSFNTGFKVVKQGNTPRRTYKTELNLKSSPVQPQGLSTNIQTPVQNGFSLVVR